MGVVPLQAPSVLVRVCPSRAVPEMLGSVVFDGGVAGGAVTVTVAEPGCPSLVAVIVAVPVATPLTSPAADTVATPLALVVHVTTRPVSTFPPASRSVAVSCTLEPTCTLGVPGATVTDATGGFNAATIAVCADCAVAEPALLLAVTLERIVSPTSDAARTYVVPVAPAIFVHAPPAASHRFH